jgi:DNA repair protein RadC
VASMPLHAIPDTLDMPSKVFHRCQSIRKLAKEHFVLFLLDTRNHILKKEVVSVGTLDAALVHPREVFRSAIAANASQVIVAHNHPSGNPEPSAEDITITNRLKKAGELIGIELLDHVVVTKDSYQSFRELSLL